MTDRSADYRNYLPDLQATPYSQAKELGDLSLALSIIYIACALLCLSAVIFASAGIYYDRFSVVPYVADGSAYGCQPSFIPADAVKDQGA